MLSDADAGWLAQEIKGRDTAWIFLKGRLNVYHDLG
jgi:hypothetical protein